MNDGELNIINKLIDKYIRNSDFTKNSLILMIGTVISQFISVAFSPIISRIYTPSDYGIIGIINSISGLLNSIFAFGFIPAIILSPTKKKRLNIVIFTTLIVFFNLIISFILFIFISKPISVLYNNKDLSFFLLFIPIGAFLFSLFSITTCYTNKNKEYKLLSISKITQAGTNSLSNMGLGLLKFKALGMILGGYIGYLISIFNLIPSLIKDIIKNIKYINKKTMLEEAKKYRSVAFTGFFADISIIATNILFIYFISLFFDVRTIGFYTFAHRIMTMPITIISATLQQTFYQKITEIFNTTGDIRPMTSKLISRMLLFSFPFFLLLFLFSPRIFSFVFGNNWYQVGIYSQALVLYVFSSFISSPVSAIPYVVRKEKIYLVLAQISNILMIASALFGGIVKKDFLWTCYFLSTLNALFTLFIIIWIYKISKIKGKNYSTQ